MESTEVALKGNTQTANIMNGHRRDDIDKPKVLPPANFDIVERVRKETERKGFMREVVITPVMAERLLTLNTHNRPVKKRKLKSYVDAMKLGHWKYSGNTLKFSESYRLLDGQHQLMATKESGTKQVFNIICGLPDDTFSVMDTGAPRSAGDVLFIGGVKNANVTAAAIKAYIYFKTKGSVGAKISDNRVSNSTVAAWLDNNNIKQMEKSVNAAVNVLAGPRSFLSQSTWAFLDYLLSKIPGAKQDAEEFMTLLSTGEMLPRTSPIYLLREKLLALKNKEVSVDGRVMEVKIKYVITAWNHYRRGEKITKLVLDTKNTAMPKPI
jgi:hypothetical protein